MAVETRGSEKFWLMIGASGTNFDLKLSLFFGQKVDAVAWFWGFWGHFWGPFWGVFQFFQTERLKIKKCAPYDTFAHFWPFFRGRILGLFGGQIFPPEIWGFWALGGYGAHFFESARSLIFGQKCKAVAM